MHGSVRVMLTLLSGLLIALCVGATSSAMAAGVLPATTESCEESQLGGIPEEGCQAITKTMISSSADPSTAGQPLTYTATVIPAPDGATVSFTELGIAVPGCEALPVNSQTGTANCAVTYPATANHTIQATYLGDAKYRTSQSDQFTQVVEGPPVLPASTHTSLVLHSSKSPSAAGQSVTFTATVTPAPPGGVVEFTDNQISIPSCRAVDVVGDDGPSASASCKLKFETPGGHTLKATYSGEHAFLGSESAPLEQIISGTSNALLAKLSGLSSPHGGKLSARFTCISVAGDCEISTTLTATGRGRGARSSNAKGQGKVTVGAKTVSIPSGKSANVTIRLNAKGRKLLARSGRLVVQLTSFAVSAGVRAQVASRSLTFG